MSPAPETAALPIQRQQAWLPVFLFFVAIVAELLCMLLSTLLRYRHQDLAPEFLEFSKTGNLLSFLLSFSFVLLFLTMAAVPRFRRATFATSAAALSSIGLVVLSAAPLAPLEQRNYIYAGYLVFKAFEVALFTVILRRPLEAWWRKTLRVFALTLSLVTIGFTVVVLTVMLSPINSTITEQPKQEYDAAVILGAAVWSGDRPSPVLRERIKRGYDLLRNGTVDFLVLTGGNAPNELPEAEVARRELLRLGVDPTRIVSETQTRSTTEQILFIREQLLKQGWKRFVIVSDQFHLKRALEIADFNELTALGVSSESPLGPQNLAIYHLRESVALILYWMFGV